MTDSIEHAQPQRGSTPVPDPTVLTTQALYREVSALRELLEQRITSINRETASSLREREAQLNSLQQLFDHRVASIDRELESTAKSLAESHQALKDLVLQRFAAQDALVEEKFNSAERQRVEQKQDTKTAVDAALQAQKEAVREQTTASALSIAKSEAATSKQLEQQQVTVSTAVDALRRSIDEVKERAAEEGRNLRTSISEIATSANGVVQQRVGAKEDRTSLYATIALSATLVIALVAVIGFLMTRVA